MERFQGIIKITFITLLFLYAFSGFTAFYKVIGMAPSGYAYAADNAPDWMKASGDDAEEEIGEIAEKIFKLFIFVAFCTGSIGFIWGVCELTGVIGEAEKGPLKIKRGIIAIVIAIIAYPVVSFLL